jgi:hypothetical protein
LILLIKELDTSHCCCMLAWVDGCRYPTLKEGTMELSIKTKRFELTYCLTDLYIRIGSWEAYWNALRPFTIW